MLHGEHIRRGAARAGPVTAFLCLLALLASCTSQTEQPSAGAQVGATAGPPKGQIENRQNPGSGNPAKRSETPSSAASNPPAKIEPRKVEAGAGSAILAKKIGTKNPSKTVEKNAVVAGDNPPKPIETTTPVQTPVKLPPPLDCDKPGSAADAEFCQQQRVAEPVEPAKSAEPAEASVYWTTPRVLISALGIFGLLATLFLARRAIGAITAAKAAKDR
jgi:hypothetical protein